MAEGMAHELATANLREEPTRGLSILVWQVPPAGFWKLNVDATFQLHSKEASCGMVLRDSQVCECQEVVLSHVQRKANMLAYKIAKIPCSVGITLTWMDVIPPVDCMS
ncbi:hypothetical protein PTKIN_Ptkin16aG0094800 [Pterospermum kingtungense]